MSRDFPSTIIVRKLADGQWCASFWHYAWGWVKRISLDRDSSLEEASLARESLDVSYPRKLPSAR
jgi:hypothetical protein